MKPKLTILVVSFSTVGPVNACVGVTRALMQRGHRVVFLIEPVFAGKLRLQGFEEIVRNNCHVTEQNPGEAFAKFMFDCGIIGPISPLEKMKIFIDQFVEHPDIKESIKNSDIDVSEAIKECSPDAILVDMLCLVPSIYYSTIPWIQCCSTNPCARLFDDSLPPGASGYPSNGINKHEWPVFRKLHRQIYYSKSFNDLMEEMGLPRYPDECRLPQTQLFTVYAFPDELNYPQIREKKELFNLEYFNKADVGQIANLSDIVPKEFIEDSLDGKFTGKWIYLSLGSMCSYDVSLMKRFVQVLSRTNHKYIVSKGHRHLQYELSRNMWGERFVAQTKLLPLVDLVITHGGNNTVTETFAQGKPMIVMPIYWDQFDNAQRVHETGFGVRLDAYKYKDAELLEAIERLLYDHELNHKLTNAARRIVSSNAHEQFCDKVENLLTAK